MVVDPSGPNFSRYAGATVLTPAIKEAEIASRRQITDVAGLEETGQFLVEQTGAALAITRGADGISLFCRERPGMVYERVTA